MYSERVERGHVDMNLPRFVGIDVLIMHEPTAQHIVTTAHTDDPSELSRMAVPAAANLLNCQQYFQVFYILQPRFINYSERCPPPHRGKYLSNPNPPIKSSSEYDDSSTQVNAADKFATEINFH